MTRLAGVGSEVVTAARAKRGHFRYESKHHGDLWLDLDQLIVGSQRLRRWVAVLAEQAADTGVEVVCGPLTGGAFVAQMLAGEIGAAFVFTERSVQGEQVTYRLPAPLQQTVAAKRVLIADDAVNAGSALLATLAEIRACGGELAAFASLITLGEAATQISQQNGVPFFTLATLERSIWSAAECPLCRAGVPLSHD